MFKMHKVAGDLVMKYTRLFVLDNGGCVFWIVKGRIRGRILSKIVKI
jgi:hypothetical protein